MQKKSFEISCDNISLDKYFSYAKTPELLEQKLIELRAQYELIPFELRVNKIHELCVYFYLPFKIEVKWIGSSDSEKNFEIKKNGRSGRFVEGDPLMVFPCDCDSPELSINIYAKGGEARYVKPFTYGVCWVEQDEREPRAKAHLIFYNYCERSWEYGDIVKTIKQARNQAIKTIEKVLSKQEGVK